MQKLKLQLDDLRVDSFDTTAAQHAKGTVFGEQCTCYTQCTCPGNATCDGSCNGTCEGTLEGPTCNISCQNSCVAYETCDGGTCAGTCAYDTCTCGGGVRTSLC